MPRSSKKREIGLAKQTARKVQREYRRLSRTEKEQRQTEKKIRRHEQWEKNRAAEESVQEDPQRAKP